jgi:hypothetical protein
MEYGAPIAAIGSPPLRYDQRGNLRGITVQEGTMTRSRRSSRRHLRYEQRGNMRGITVQGCKAHCNRHWPSHCPAPDPTLDQNLFLNSMMLLESCKVVPLWSKSINQEGNQNKVARTPHTSVPIVFVDVSMAQTVTIHLLTVCIEYFPRRLLKNYM